MKKNVWKFKASDFGPEAIKEREKFHADVLDLRWSLFPWLCKPGIELKADRDKILAALKKDLKRRTVRVKSILP